MRTPREMSAVNQYAIVVLLVVGLCPGLAAAGHSGRVTFAGLQVPGATVTASRGEQQIVTSTDEQGIYRFSDLGDGVWTMRVEMLGFSTTTRDITIAGDVPSSNWELKVLPFEEITRGLPPASTEAAPRAAESATTARQANAPGSAAPASRQEGFQRTGVSAPPGAPVPANDPKSPGDDANGDLGFGAADGMLINGSVNNGAASPFAQLAAFGNNRRGGRSLYTGGVAALLGNSAWDARPFSFAGDTTSKPAYNDVQVVGTFGGPLKIPRLFKNGPNLFVQYQHASDHTANTQPALLPTSLERGGDFSHTRDALGRPVQLVDPSTGLPFPGNVIPRERISPQAAALLGYYPLPNLSAASQYNWQSPLVTVTRQDMVQSRLTQPGFGRNQMFGNATYQRTTTEAANVFGFTDATTVSGLDTAINWSRRFSQFFSLRLRYQFTRQTTEVMPHFANRVNVSGDAGITGNNQDSVNWGPPNVYFSDGLESLTEVQYASNTNQTNAWSAESLWSHGRHNITFGGGVHRQRFDALSQQNARGAFTFTGTTTGSALGDFLLGIPHTSAIGFGNADKYLRGSSYETYVSDDWRVSPGLTVNAGLRWEYEAPMTELFGRLVNLDVAPGFVAVSPVVAERPVGALTGQVYPESLLHPDNRGVQPRVGVAWRPVPGSSLVIRGGYGIYRNTSVYLPIALLLAQQPPLSKAFSVENNGANPLTLADGFVAAPGATPNTFAVDPDFRVGYVENWQASVQKDLPASLTVLATYLGTRGSRLMQEFLPNTYPLGAATPCATCPSGFVYLTSNGRSARQAGQVQVRRRLRNGLTATVQYTLAKATDDAGAFTGVSLTGSAIAQDWLNLDAEWAPSNFDQRHLLTAQFQYSTGVGVGGGTLLKGLKGSLFKGWTVVTQLTAGSGLPLTPVYLTSVAGTGVTGTIRPDYAGATSNDAVEGLYANPSAFAPPAAGRWGNAGRNSIVGPAQFVLNGGAMRTFTLGDRWSLDWRVDAANLLNRVTYSGVSAIVGSPQFGLPNRANSMRKLQTSLRLRF